MKLWWLVAVLVACGSKGDDKPKETKQPPAEPFKRESFDIAVPVWDEPLAPLPVQESFKLIDAGTGPKSELRYQLAAGTAQHRAETRLESRHLANRKWGDKAALPPIRDGFAITIDADAQKPLLVRPIPGEVVGKATPDTDAYLAMSREIGTRRFSLPFDARGQLGDLAFLDDPAGTRNSEHKDEIMQRMLVSIVPLPAEPVGVGAKWQVVTALRQRPAAVKQTALYALKARTAKSWQIEVTVRRVAEEQILRDPALPQRAEARLVALVRRYEGTVEVDPHHPMPTGTLGVDATMHVRFTLDGKSDEQIFEDVGSVKFSTEN